MAAVPACTGATTSANGAGATTGATRGNGVAGSGASASGSRSSAASSAGAAISGSGRGAASVTQGQLGATAASGAICTCASGIAAKGALDAAVMAGGASGQTTAERGGTDTTVSASPCGLVMPSPANARKAAGSAESSSPSASAMAMAGKRPVGKGCICVMACTFCRDRRQFCPQRVTSSLLLSRMIGKIRTNGRRRWK